MRGVETLTATLTPTLSRKREREPVIDTSHSSVTERCGSLPLPLAGEGGGEGRRVTKQPSGARRQQPGPFEPVFELADVRGDRVAALFQR